MRRRLPSCQPRSTRAIHRPSARLAMLPSPRPRRVAIVRSPPCGRFAVMRSMPRDPARREATTRYATKYFSEVSLPTSLRTASRVPSDRRGSVRRDGVRAPEPLRRGLVRRARGGAHTSSKPAARVRTPVTGRSRCPYGVPPLVRSTALVRMSCRSASTGTRRTLPTRTQGISPLFISSYTLLRLTRRASAASIGR